MHNISVLNGAFTPRSQSEGVCSLVVSGGEKCTTPAAMHLRCSRKPPEKFDPPTPDSSLRLVMCEAECVGCESQSGGCDAQKQVNHSVQNVNANV